MVKESLPHLIQYLEPEPIPEFAEDTINASLKGAYGKYKIVLSVTNNLQRSPLFRRPLSFKITLRPVGGVLKFPISFKIKAKGFRFPDKWPLEKNLFKGYSLHSKDSAFKERLFHQAGLYTDLLSNAPDIKTHLRNPVGLYECMLLLASDWPIALTDCREDFLKINGFCYSANEAPLFPDEILLKDCKNLADTILAFSN